MFGNGTFCKPPHNSSTKLWFDSSVPDVLSLGMSDSDRFSQTHLNT